MLQDDAASSSRTFRLTLPSNSFNFSALTVDISEICWVLQGWSIVRLKTTRSMRLPLRTTALLLAAQRVALQLLALRPTTVVHPSVPIWQAHHMRVSHIWPSMQFAVPWTLTASLTPSSCHVHPVREQMTCLESLRACSMTRMQRPRRTMRLLRFFVWMRVGDGSLLWLHIFVSRLWSSLRSNPT